METVLRFVLAIALSLLSTAFAAAGHATTRGATVLDAVTARELAAVMAEFGYDIELKDENGPALVTRRGETKFTISFYGCDKNPDVSRRICGDAQFRSSYNLPDAASLNLMNKWNNEFRFGKAYVNGEGRATVEMTINLDGGVTKSYLHSLLKWWGLVLRDFEAYIGW